MPPTRLARPPLLRTLALSLLLALSLTFLHPSASHHLEPLHQHINAALAPMHSAFEERVRPGLRKVVDVYYWSSKGAAEPEGDLGDQLSHVVFSHLHASHSHPHHTSSTPKPELPPCPRSFIYRLHGSRPFAEEVLRMGRSVAVAEKMGYTAFVRSEGWKWGEWEDYFTQPTANCSLEGTPTWSERRGMNPSFGVGAVAEVASGSDSSAKDEEQPEEAGAEDYASPPWSEQVHICDGTSDAYLHPLFLAHFTSPTRLHRLRQTELSSYPPRLPLDAGETLPAELGEAWRAMRGVLERWWVLNEEMRGMVESEARARGWESEEREVVGVVVGMSDECPEEIEKKYSPLRLLTPVQLSRYRRRFPSAPCPSPSPSSSSLSLSTSITQTYLNAISSALSNSPTSEASLLSEPVVAIVLSSEGEGKGEETEKEGRRVLEQLQRANAGKKHEEEEEGRAEMLLFMEWSEAESEEQTESEQRVRRMKEVVRSWTVLSEKTDSLVISQVSDVGRLLTLLAGPEMITSGRVISVDARWFPGTYYS